MTIIFYIAFEIISLLLFYLGQKNIKSKPKLGKLFIVLSFIILLLIAGLRHISVGRDTSEYANTLDRIVNNTMLTTDYKWLSIGYIYINKLIGILFGSNYVALNLIISFLTLIFLYKSILENSESSTMSLYIFISMCLYYQSFNQSRQILALSMIIYSYKFLKNRNLFKYIAIILLAASIHKSALVMLPFYFILNININKKTLISYSIIALSIVLFSDLIIELISKTSYGSIYANTSFFTPQKSSFYNLFVRLIMLGCSFFFGKKYIVKDKNSKYLFNLVIWCTLLQIITIKINIFGRITTYFYVFYIFLIPEVFKHMNKKSKMITQILKRLNEKNNKNKNKKIKKLLKYINKNYKKIVKILVIVIFILYHIVYYYFSVSNSDYGVYKFFFMQ